ncbi:MAG TPA: GFA family protein [Polyangiaceae bacterium]|nr:GFA family protein [Polyangiaceae bacterium]
MLSGGCLCGAVRYRITTNIKYITHCHCSMCRKQHGAAFASYALIGSKHVQIEDAEAQLCTYASSPSASRRFCGRCGSSLFWQQDSTPQLIDVALGTLDDDPVHRADAHIFVASKAPWFEITDDLPQYEALMPDPKGT